MENARIADRLEEIADLLELQDENPFRVRSYRNASRSVGEHPRRLAEMAADRKELTEISGIGESIADDIREIARSGTCQRLEKLRERVPRSLTRLLRVPDLGPKTAAMLYRELSVRSLDDLKEAAENGRIRELSGMGEKTEENLLRGLKTLRSSMGRISLQRASEFAATLAEILEGTQAVRKWEMAGSFRRGRETVGDLDILVQSDDRDAVCDRLTGSASTSEVIGRGEEKLSIRLEGGLQVDIRFFEPAAFGAALLYFTGSKDHNIALRRLAGERDWKLNEYGLYKGDRLLAGRTEAAVYHRLNLSWIPPELREDRGEIQAAGADALPDLVREDQVRGDFHSHTDWTDGKSSLEEMADAARRKGYRFLAVTEHSQAVTVANGLDEDGLRRHLDRVREAGEAAEGLRILAGIEVDILEDGSLDLPRKALSELDWVVASIHSHFRMDSEAMTERLLAAVHSGVVHCLGHPTARMIGSRDPIRFDAERVFEACADRGVSLEINAQPDRMDLPDTLCRKAREAGATFTLATDAHHPVELDFMRYGVLTARRGWLRKEDILNTLDVVDLELRLGL